MLKVDFDAKISRILIKFQRAFERISYNSSRFEPYSGMRIRNPYTLRLRTSVRKRKHDVKRIFFKNEVRKRNCILGFLKIDVRKLNCILSFLKIDVRKINCRRIFFQS